MVIKFEEGQTYQARHIGDAELVTSFTITKRREKTIWVYEGFSLDVISRRIYVHEGVEKAKIESGITINADRLESLSKMEKHTFIFSDDESGVGIGYTVYANGEMMIVRRDPFGNVQPSLHRMRLSAPEIEQMLINPNIDEETKKFLGRVLVNITGF